jgi:hypothetical protein
MEDICILDFLPTTTFMVSEERFQELRGLFTLPYDGRLLGGLYYLKEYGWKITLYNNSIEVADRGTFKINFEGETHLRLIEFFTKVTLQPQNYVRCC